MKEYRLDKHTAQRVMHEALEEVYEHAVTKLRVELTGAVDELPMIHVEYDAHAYQYAAEQYLSRRSRKKGEVDESRRSQGDAV